MDIGQVLIKLRDGAVVTSSGNLIKSALLGGTSWLHTSSPRQCPTFFFKTQDSSDVLIRLFLDTLLAWV